MKITLTGVEIISVNLIFGKKRGITLRIVKQESKV